MKALLKKIIEKAKKQPKTIIFPESTEKRILEAVKIITAKRIANVILLGNVKEILSLIKKHEINLKHVKIIDPRKADTEEYALMFYKLRKNKGITLSKARKIVKDPLYLGISMVKLNEADGLVSGATHSTAATLKPAFQILRKGNKKASSFFLMKHNYEFYVFADCAVNIDPDAKTLAEIALTTVESVKQLFNFKQPRVAMLSFSTHGSTKHPYALEIRKATLLAKKQLSRLFPGTIIDGEVQADAALSSKVCELKCKECVLKGKSNILIFPNLEAANISYKLVEWLGHYEAVGPIIQGLSKPVNDLSRGCDVKDIVNVCAITVVQAQPKKYQR